MPRKSSGRDSRRTLSWPVSKKNENGGEKTTMKYLRIDFFQLLDRGGFGRGVRRDGVGEEGEDGGRSERFHFVWELPSEKLKRNMRIRYNSLNCQYNQKQTKKRRRRDGRRVRKMNQSLVNRGRRIDVHCIVSICLGCHRTLAMSRDRQWLRGQGEFVRSHA